MDEGWYSFNLRGTDSIAYHFMINFMDDVIRSRCGQHAPTKSEVLAMIRVEPDPLKGSLCGNCERLIVYDNDPRNNKKEPERY